MQITGTKVKDDPYVLYAISEAAAEIAAARAALLDNVSRMYDMVEAGKQITFEERAIGRRTQVQAAWRAVRGDGRDRGALGGQRHADRQSDPAVLAGRARRVWRTPSTCRGRSSTSSR